MKIIMRKREEERGGSIQDSHNDADNAKGKEEKVDRKIKMIMIYAFLLKVIIFLLSRTSKYQSTISKNMPFSLISI